MMVMVVTSTAVAPTTKASHAHPHSIHGHHPTTALIVVVTAINHMFCMPIAMRHLTLDGVLVIYFHWFQTFSICY